MAPWPAGTAVALLVERMKPQVGATLPKQEQQLRTRPLSFPCHPPSRTGSVYKARFVSYAPRRRLGPSRPGTHARNAPKKSS
jgi:hypothetical protein